jgi:hypothetical protein
VKQHLKFCLQYLYEKNGVEVSLKYCGIFVDYFVFLLAIVVQEIMSKGDGALTPITFIYTAR